jgi:adenine phosphoribosyltransferase
LGKGRKINYLGRRVEASVGNGEGVNAGNDGKQDTVADYWIYLGKISAMTLQEELDQVIRTVPDFPKPGIQFKDITPLLENPDLSRRTLDRMKELVKPLQPDCIIGVESRGFLFGMSLAIELGVPFVTVRKKGKLPYKTVTYKYDLEYGSAEVEMHVDSIKPGWKVLVHDDLLATGGTAAAAAELALMQGGQLAGFCFLVELGFLNGKEKLKSYSPNIINLVTF